MAAKSMTEFTQTGNSGNGSELRQVPLIERNRRLAERRASEYLRAHGLTDPEQLGALSRRWVEASQTSSADGADHPAATIAYAQQDVNTFLTQLVPERNGDLNPLWLRAFIETYPQHFLGDLAAARAAAQAFGDPVSGTLPRSQQFTLQALPTMRFPSWLAGLIPPAVITTGLTALLTWDLSRSNGLSALELLWASSFAFVFSAPAIGFTTALSGLFYRKRAWLSSRRKAELPRSALLMPIYHEDPERVFAALAAMRESLLQTAGGDCFDIFVLSDSRDLACAADEERALRRICALANDDRIPIYYRRRIDNAGHKAGNLAEFCERFGPRYRYALVLDADSLMTGQAMVELVHRMERKPRLALLQAALHLRAGQTLLALSQQLVASVCGPLFMRGLARWSGPHGNYYGHNAIIRVRAFVECCALPLLPGAPPFGGHFLSHDFVEAALLCRAGWEVGTAWDVADSWEEMPQTLAGYTARDRRWCQGNLQHLRIVLAQGLRPMSRLHLLIGALAYLNGPALLCFLALGVWVAHAQGATGLSTITSSTLLGGALIALTMPRLFGLIDTLRDRTRRRLHGGTLRLLVSVTLETTLATIAAPVLLLHHARTVLSIVTGGAVGWGGQSREGAFGSFREALRLELPATLFGGAVAAFTFWLDPQTALFLSPCWAPMLLSIPIAAALSSQTLGQLARRLRLFMTPCETEPDEVLTRAQALRVLTQQDEAARFRDLVLDPLLLSAHLQRLPEESSGAKDAVISARDRAVRMGPAALSPKERRLLENDREAMRYLHKHAWRRWPVESWELPRTHPQTPQHTGEHIEKTSSAKRPASAAPGVDERASEL